MDSFNRPTLTRNVWCHTSALPAEVTYLGQDKSRHCWAKIQFEKVDEAVKAWGAPRCRGEFEGQRLHFSLSSVFLDCPLGSKPETFRIRQGYEGAERH